MRRMRKESNEAGHITETQINSSCAASEGKGTRIQVEANEN